jgi:hypothetical protein
MTAWQARASQTAAKENTRTFGAPRPPMKPRYDELSRRQESNSLKKTEGAKEFDFENHDEQDESSLGISVDGAFVVQKNWVPNTIPERERGCGRTRTATVLGVSTRQISFR